MGTRSTSWNEHASLVSMESSLSWHEKVQSLVKASYTAHCCGAMVSLHNIGSAPPHLTSNQFIVRGYRGYLSLGDSLRSMFVWSNETINIWTHGLGFVYFLLALVYDNAISLNVTQATLEERFIISILLICYCSCMFCSFAFHTFSSHSAGMYTRWLQFDLFGISLVACSSFVTGTYFGFSCFPVHRKAYSAWAMILGVICITMVSQRRLLSNRFHTVRLVVFVAAVASGLIPAAHWVILHGGLWQPFVQLFLPRIVLLFGSLGAGVFFYTCQIPEICCPGYFDYLGASHQVWHCFVLVALVSWRQSGLTLLSYLHATPCQAIVPR